MTETITTMEAAPAASTPPPACAGTPSAADIAKYIARQEADVVFHLAGNAAARRALQGSEPGWRRLRSGDELRAFHEAGHAVAIWAAGGHPWWLSIVADETVRIGKTGFEGGVCWGGGSPLPPGPCPRPARAESDLRKAAGVCLALCLFEGAFGWRPALRIARRLRASTRALVENHWWRVVVLADELMRRRVLDHEAIAKLLGSRPS
ncbi:MAG TPA: hypothetical protein VME43_10320 [Bryobacteraceae bacterium]|nr:hypothetical protein [Bryobacteraceae bacterium]